MNPLGPYTQGLWIPRSRKAALALLGCIVLFAALVAALAAIGWVSYTQDDLEDAAVGICNRAKPDRVENARAWTKAEEVWTERALDPKLSAEERARAHAAATVYGESANQLRTRLFECDPLIRDEQERIDERALREAQGDL